MKVTIPIQLTVILLLERFTEIQGAKCSTANCKLAYSGIPKSICLNFGCCWDAVNIQCKEVNRKKCPSAYPGAPRRFCESKGCVFDPDTNGCYAESEDVTAMNLTSTPEPGLEVRDRSGLSISTEENPATATVTSNIACDKKHCTLAYHGIPKAKCIQFGCCWDYGTKQCKQPLRHPCVVAYPGAPRSVCEEWGCVYDEAHNTCLATTTGNDANSATTTGSVVTSTSSILLPGSTTVQTTLKAVEGRTGNTDDSDGHLGVQCPPLPKPENGIFDCISQTPDKLGCFLFCNAGYYATDLTKVTCEKNRKWSPTTLPQCEEIECPPLTLDGNKSQTKINCTKQRSYNSTCMLSCHEGYVAQGNNTKVCKSNGKWSKGQFKCLPVSQCDDFKSSPVADWNLLQMTCTHNDLRVGTNCRFKCTQNFVLNGAESLACNLNLKWSGNLPTCTPMLSALSQVAYQLNLKSGRNDPHPDERFHLLSKQRPWFSFSSCSYQAVVKVNITSLKSLTVALDYQIPSFEHFQLIAPGTSLSLKGDFTRMLSDHPLQVINNNVFRTRHTVIIHVVPKTEKVHYLVQRANRNIPVLSSIHNYTGKASELIFGLNRYASNANFASGLCKVTFSYNM